MMLQILNEFPYLVGNVSGCLTLTDPRLKYRDGQRPSTYMVVLNLMLPMKMDAPNPTRTDPKVKPNPIWSFSLSAYSITESVIP